MKLRRVVDSSGRVADTDTLKISPIWVRSYCQYVGVDCNNNQYRKAWSLANRELTLHLQTSFPGWLKLQCPLVFLFGTSSEEMLLLLLPV